MTGAAAAPGLDVQQIGSWQLGKGLFLPPKRLMAERWQLVPHFWLNTSAHIGY